MQIASSLVGANNAINTIQANLAANGKTSTLLSTDADKMTIALADMQNQSPAYVLNP